MNIAIPDNFDWGDLDESTKNFVARELALGRVYEYYNRVKPGDVVMDIGACVGLFSYRSLCQGASKVYCVEPSNRLIKACINNTSEFFINQKENPVVFINHAIGGLSDFSKTTRDSFNIFGKERNISTISFADLVQQNKIERINFLKLDCEGGEYDVFTHKNLNYLKHNVDFIACEMHGREFYNETEFRNFNESNSNTLIEKFKFFIKEILPHFPYHKFVSMIDSQVYDATDFFHMHELHPVWAIMESELMLYISKTPLDYKVPLPLPGNKIQWD